ncbi:MAG TPA: Gfo/Idh/MocA family oxidoreductase [Steroidobacteraceae bacterium]|nr:Gfo/Idh/MocA family oxidoreductase [Steroidobacteraceae bacterium]
MPDIFAPIRAATAIHVRENHKLPIAVIGAGEIVDLAHLPAYAAHGLNVAGIFDLDKDKAKAVAARHEIPKVYASTEEIGRDQDVAVVDIAVFPWVQCGIAAPLLDAGKHLLCQKPISYDLSEAVRLVEHAARRERLMAVNQQLRFSESVAAARAMVSAGWIGEPFEMSWDFNVYTPWENWAWVAKQPRLDLNQFTIHFIDAVRFVLGRNPRYAYGTQAREPGQPEQGETRTISVLEFAGETRAFLRSFHKNRSGDPRAEFRIDGTKGSIRGTIGLMYDYPRGRADTLEVSSRVLPTDGWLHYPVTSRWIPTAFIGPMASLLEAVSTRSVPLTNAQDNLDTLRIVHALYRSGEQHVVVKL